LLVRVKYRDVMVLFIKWLVYWYGWFICIYVENATKETDFIDKLPARDI